MGCISKLCRNIFIGLLSLIKVGISVAIIIIVAIHLYKNDKIWKDGIDKPVCLMTGSVKGSSVCEYTFAVCGVSMFLSFITSVFLCITCDMCGLGDWLEFAVGGLQTAWWVIAAIIISKNARNSNDANMPNEDWRNAVAVMSWVNAFAAFLCTLVFFCQACKCLKKCCCSSDDEDDHGGKRSRV